MPNKIIHKKTGTTGLAPAPGELDHAELAVNYADGDLYLKNLAGDAVVKVTAASNIKSAASGLLTATNVQNALGQLLSLQLQPIQFQAQTVTTNVTVPENHHALSASPLTIAAGVTVSIPSGSVWTIV